MKATGRFGTQTPSAPFSHLQQPNLPHRAYQPPNASGLPPPSFNHAFAQGNTNANINPFAPTGNVNGLAGGFGPGGGFGTGGTGLASREAQERFAHGAALQQQQQARDQIRRTSGGGSKGQQKQRIRDVWSSNLVEEMHVLRELVDDYPYISMDTEFPGIVARPMGAFINQTDYHYQTLRCNVDLLKVIQLGITLFNEDGESPPARPDEDSDVPPYRSSPTPCTWQFNFQFSLDDDMYNQESIEFLHNHGLELERFEREGIDPAVFGSILITSGLVMFQDVKWISFHSGYDFAYLIKLMTCKELPEDETEYRKLLKLHFPSVYDIKFMIKDAQRSQTVNDTPLTAAAATIINGLGPKGFGLEDLARQLGVKRLGLSHQAGSDSHLTGKVFWEAKASLFNGTIDEEKYLGQVWGLKGLSGGSGPAGAGHAVTPNLNGATIYTNPPNQGTPSTPASAQTGPSSTPNQQSAGINGGGIASLTPGGGGGVFGAFRAFGKG